MENREIKFRAWNPEIKKMSKPFGFNHVMDFTNAEGLGYVKTITNEVLMQFTGLHDKTGKEIYEGDYFIIDSVKLVVIFEDGKFCFDNTGGSYGRDFIGQDRVGRLIIAGNIYEHHHLLKQ
jgi:uncharacterized phage protein (TIGR01671 family)